LYWPGAHAAASGMTHGGEQGYLATITSQAENDFILNQVTANTWNTSIIDQFFLGGVWEGGAWRWLTGEPFAYTNWNAGEPNHVGTEDKVATWGPNINDEYQSSPDERIPGMWNDTQGDAYTYWAIVEFGDPLKGTGAIAGTIQLDGSGQSGVRVDIWNADGEVIGSDVTDDAGQYRVSGLDAGMHVVTAPSPLGFSVEQDVVAVAVASGDHRVDFVLQPGLADQFQHVWWWKMHLTELREDASKCDVFTIDDINGWCVDIFEHFADRADEHGIQIENVTFLSAPNRPVDFDALCTFLLDAPVPEDRIERYEQRYERYLVAHLLNFASNKLSQLAVVSEDGATASQATTYLTSIYNSGDLDELMIAYVNLRRIHLSESIPTGVIPADVPTVMYRPGDPGVPDDFFLAQNYPNPFNPETHIDFTLPTEADVELEIVNVLGQKVATLFAGMLGAGSHAVTWNASSCASGVYFYRLRAGSLTSSRKMVLLK